MNQGETPRDIYARDRNGRIITDRYGRPVRKRDAGAAPHDRSFPAQSPRPQTDNRAVPQAEHRGAPQPGFRAAPQAGNRATPPAGNQAAGEPPRYRRSTTPSAQGRPPAAGSATGAAYSPQVRPMYPEGSGLQPNGNYPAGPAPRGGYPQGSYPQGSFPPAANPRAFQPGNRTSAPSGNRRGRRGFKGIRRTLLLVLVIILALVTGTALWADTKLNRVEAIQTYENRVGNTAGTNWLLVGSDSRAGLTAEDADRLMAGDLNETIGHTDTIMLVHVPFVGKATMISLPRDSWVNIPGHGQNKINAAFSLGGAPLLQRTVEEATGLRVDRYAEIGFGGFANLVDALGGVNICVNEPMNDPMAGINLAAGCQDMDGATALGYVRSRYVSANGDLDRVERQRQFLSAIASKLTSPSTLLNPFTVFPTIGAGTSTLTVNSKDHVWNLARLGLAVASGAEQATVPIGGYMDTYAGSVVVWDEVGAQELFGSIR